MAGKRKARRPRHPSRPVAGKPQVAREPSGRLILLPILIVLIAVAAYVPSFSGAFVFDDTVHIVDSTRIRQLWPPSIVLAGRRPLVDLSLAVNYAIGGISGWPIDLKRYGNGSDMYVDYIRVYAGDDR